MMQQNNAVYRVLAMDFGASNGRAILGEFDGISIRLREIYRFANDPVELNGVLYWDFPRLFHEIKQSLLQLRGQELFPKTIGIDTWGVDFGLLNADGFLLDNPWHYRNTMGSGARDALLAKILPQKLYEKTGLAMSEFNTVFQLYHMKQRRPDLFEKADRLLFMPDLFNWFLTGQAGCEYTVATTSQLLNVVTRDWDSEILEMLGISARLLLPVTQPGISAAPLLPALCRELKLESLEVVRVASHDTHAAFMAVPFADKGENALINCGTWAIVGREVDTPILHTGALHAGCSNEGTVGGRYNFVSNLTGLWLLQECRRQWQRKGETVNFDREMEMAIKAEPFSCLMDPDDPVFVAPSDMPEQICKYAVRSSQKVPLEKGAMVRAVTESLAMKFRYALDQQDRLCGKRAEQIYIIGGGAKDKLLCQFTANATGRPVVTGPNEATAIGNVLSQLLYAGVLGSLAQARSFVVRSFSRVEYLPQDIELWNAQYGRFIALLG
jgi:rhamnulokinase